jgi:transcriptional regulator with XRE-family HTH domain
LADALRQCRLDAGLTQEALAASAGITREYLSQVERAKKNPTVDVFVRLCAAMRVHPSDVLESLVPRGGTSIRSGTRGRPGHAAPHAKR